MILNKTKPDNVYYTYVDAENGATKAKQRSLAANARIKIVSGIFCFCKQHARITTAFPKTAKMLRARVKLYIVVQRGQS